MRYLLGIIICGAAMAQPWSGVIDTNRATDWSTAGIPGGIPPRTTACATLGSAGQSASFSQSVTAAQINNALGSCPAGLTVVLNPGTYTADTCIELGNNVTLRGSGADQTKLNFTGHC